MIVIAVVASGPKDQQPQQKIISGKETAGADDFSPAVIGGETLAQEGVRIGFRLQPAKMFFNGGDGGGKIGIKQHAFAEALRQMAEHWQAGRFRFTELA